MDTDVQLGIHQTVFILHLTVSRRCKNLLLLASSSNLACGVDNFREEGLTLVDDLMAESVLDRGIVAFNEVAFAVSDGERGFA